MTKVARMKVNKFDYRVNAMFPDNVKCPDCRKAPMKKESKCYSCPCGFSATTDFIVGFWTMQGVSKT